MVFLSAISSVLNEQLSNADSKIHLGDNVQRCIPLGIRNRGIRATVQETLRFVLVPSLGGIVQRRRALLILNLDDSSLLQEEGENLNRGCPGCRHQWGIAVAIARFHICPMRDEELGDH